MYPFTSRLIENGLCPTPILASPFYSRINGNADPADIKESAPAEDQAHDSFGNLTLVTQP